MIVHDMATVFVVVVDTAVAWVQVLAAAGAFVLCVAAFVAGPFAAQAVWAVRKRVTGPSWARGRLRAARWVRTRSRDYDTAA